MWWGGVVGWVRLGCVWRESGVRVRVHYVTHSKPSAKHFTRSFTSPTAVELWITLQKHTRSTPDCGLSWPPSPGSKRIREAPNKTKLEGEAQRQLD